MEKPSWYIEGRSWDEQTELWEHQGHPLTVAALKCALDQLDPDLAVQVVLYDGADPHPLLPMELGLIGEGPAPSALVITVVESGRT